MSTVKKTKSTEKGVNGTALSVVKGKEEENAPVQDELQKRLEELEAENKKLTNSVSTVRKSKQAKEAELKKERAERERIEKELNKRKPAKLVDVLIKAQALTAMSERLTHLQEKKKELSAFSFASTKLGEALTLKDSSGKQFTTSNPEALKFIHEGLQKLIQGKITEVEMQLLGMA
ncbi:MAG: hypothetical protein ACPGJS_00615 [Flammeovirgaceae bacterium]